MTNFKAALVACAVVLPFQAQAQTACEAYTVASGDTLRLIAERVYGTRDLSPVIYNANRQVVGGNPNRIEIGMRLQIPCDTNGEATGAVRVVTGADVIIIATNGEMPELPAPADANTTTPQKTTDMVSVTPPPPEPQANIETEPAQAGIRFPDQPIFVSVGIFPPFADGDGNGLMTDIAGASLSDAAYLEQLEINAVSLPFDPLMAASDPDVLLSFPWINPICDNAEFLSDRSRSLCENYVFSDPAYEIVMTFFVADRGGLAQAATPEEFSGNRICVPEQYPVSHLATAGFIRPDITIERGNSVAECMSKLLAGQTNVVNADYLSVESTYAVLKSQSIIVENPSFTWIRSVHALANGDNPASQQTLIDFNDGLAKIKDSGQWRDLAQQYLN